MVRVQIALLLVACLMTCHAISLEEEVQNSSIISLHSHCQDASIANQLMEVVGGEEYLQHVGMILVDSSKVEVEEKLAGNHDFRQYLGVSNANNCIKMIESDQVATTLVHEHHETIKLTEGQLKGTEPYPESTTNTWHLDRVNQRARPLDNNSSPQVISTNTVHAYVIDSGIDREHELLSSKCAPNDDDHYVALKNDTDDCSFYACDKGSHGTHVAGLFASDRYGYNPNATLHAVKVFPKSGTGTVSSCIRGINWIINYQQGTASSSVSSNGVKSSTDTAAGVANFSLASNTSGSLNSAIQTLTEAGVTAVVAAGNSHKDACLSSPASEPTAITVGASSKSDNKSSYSNWGDCVDIFAPGNSIWSTVPDNSVGKKSGTSMASPVAAGVISGGAAKYSDLAAPSNAQQTYKCLASTGIISNSNSTANNDLIYDGIPSDFTLGDCRKPGWGIRGIGPYVIAGVLAAIVLATLCSAGNACCQKRKQKKLADQSEPLLAKN